MKLFYILFIASVLAACNNQQDQQAGNDSSVSKTDSSEPANTTHPDFDEHIHSKDTVDLYSNKRFRNVRLEKLNDTSYRITGKAQVWEATLSWVVEDGHNVTQSGYTNTDAGAPEFGNFNFILNAKKTNPHATYILILFEASANDGSRQHELPIVLN